MLYVENVYVLLLSLKRSSLAPIFGRASWGASQTPTANTFPKVLRYK